MTITLDDNVLVTSEGNGDVRTDTIEIPFADFKLGTDGINQPIAINGDRVKVNRHDGEAILRTAEAMKYEWRKILEHSPGMAERFGEMPR